MRSLLTDPSLEGPLGSYVNEFRTQISNLDQRIEELAARVAPPRTEPES
jgi:CHASE3 domain sensor protein